MLIEFKHPQGKYMGTLKVIFGISILILILSTASCTSIQKNESYVTRDVAIMIAAANAPSSIFNDASTATLTLWDDSTWTVNFLLTQGMTISKDELGWPEALTNKYENNILPKGTFTLLTFDIDRKTGAVLLRRASDGVLLGGPGTWNTEPPEIVLFPLWAVIAAGVVGVLIGGLLIFSLFYLKRVKT
ncbi:MAG: hypothetical protein JW954_05700 [Dehalococcoidaceae bacterium]|nr:hypothetical protein [Dehalococcoidaceae bacterium]